MIRRHVGSKPTEPLSSQFICQVIIACRSLRVRRWLRRVLPRPDERRADGAGGRSGRQANEGGAVTSGGPGAEHASVQAAPVQSGEENRRMDAPEHIERLVVLCWGLESDGSMTRWMSPFHRDSRTLLYMTFYSSALPLYANTIYNSRLTQVHTYHTLHDKVFRPRRSKKRSSQNELVYSLQNTQ